MEVSKKRDHSLEGRDHTSVEKVTTKILRGTEPQEGSQNKFNDEVSKMVQRCCLIRQTTSNQERLKVGS